MQKNTPYSQVHMEHFPGYKMLDIKPNIYMILWFILSHKSNLSKFKKIEIVSGIFSDHNAKRLDINYKKKTVRNTNTWWLNNMLLNNQQVTEEIKREIKNF